MNFSKIFTKSLKIIFITIVVSIPVALIFTAWFIYYTGELYPGELHPIKIFMSKEEKFFHKKLEELATSDKDFVSLNELTNFEWDETCYAFPYSYIDNKKIKEFKLDRTLPDSDDDSKSAIIFLNNKTASGKVFILYQGEPEVRFIENNFKKEVCKTH